MSGDFVEGLRLAAFGLLVFVVLLVLAFTVGFCGHVLWDVMNKGWGFAS